MDNPQEFSQDVIDLLSCGTDYYKVLNLDKSFTDIELKKSYRKLALKFHPDKNTTPGADEAFRLVSRAFTVLSDPTKKILYDINGDPTYSPAYNSDAFVGTDLRNTTQQPKKKILLHWSFVWKVSPIIALLAYSVFSGVFSKDAPVFTAM